VVAFHLIHLPPHLSSLLRRHLLPSMKIVQHALALLRWQLLEALIALDELIASRGRQ